MIVESWNPQSVTCGELISSSSMFISAHEDSRS